MVHLAVFQRRVETVQHTMPVPVRHTAPLAAAVLFDLLSPLQVPIVPIATVAAAHNRTSHLQTKMQFKADRGDERALLVPIRDVNQTSEILSVFGFFAVKKHARISHDQDSVCSVKTCNGRTESGWLVVIFLCGRVIVI